MKWYWLLLIVIGVLLIIQSIRYNICKSNVEKALINPSLQEKYKNCTVDGFHKEQLERNSITKATIKVFPFSILLQKWSNSNEIYWDNI